MAAAAATRRLEDPAARALLAKKETLLLRPIGRLLEDPHALAGFIGRHHGQLWKAERDEVSFIHNPIHVLQELYHYLNMDFEEGKPASEMI